MKINPFQNKAFVDEADLNITPFLSLMVVLIPVLLVSAKFSLLAQYNVYQQPESALEEFAESNTLTPYLLRITEDELVLSQGETQLFQHEIADRMALKQALHQFLQTLSEPTPLQISLESVYTYQDVVGLLDVIHSFSSKFLSISMNVAEGEHL